MADKRTAPLGAKVKSNLTLGTCSWDHPALINPGWTALLTAHLSAPEASAPAQTREVEMQQAVKSTGLGSDSPGFESQLCLSLPMWFTSYVASLSFSFVICEMGRRTAAM